MEINTGVTHFERIKKFATLSEAVEDVRIKFQDVLNWGISNDHLAKIFVAFDRDLEVARWSHANIQRAEYEEYLSLKTLIINTHNEMIKEENAPTDR
jgi:hypothetical protein